MDRWEVERAIRTSELPPLARLVALSLLTRADAATAIVPERYSPSLSVLAADTGLNRSSVARHLNILEREGWVTRLRDPGRAYSDKAPTRYRLHVPGAGRTERLVAEKDQSQTATSRREQQGLVAESSTTSRTVRPNQNSEPKPEQQTLPAARDRADPYAAAGFAEFWDCYPRQVAKRAAARAYVAAIRRGADPAAVIKGACRYRDDPGRDPRFTQHPATWLNADRWLDGQPERRMTRDERAVANGERRKAEMHRTRQNGATRDA